jgi:hypothetical protein
MANIMLKQKTLVAVVLSLVSTSFSVLAQPSLADPPGGRFVPTPPPRPLSKEELDRARRQAAAARCRLNPLDVAQFGRERASKLASLRCRFIKRPVR